VAEYRAELRFTDVVRAGHEVARSQILDVENMRDRHVDPAASHSTN